MINWLFLILTFPSAFGVKDSVVFQDNISQNTIHAEYVSELTRKTKCVISESDICHLPPFYNQGPCPVCLEDGLALFGVFDCLKADNIVHAEHYLCGGCLSRHILPNLFASILFNTPSVCPLCRSKLCPTRVAKAYQFASEQVPANQNDVLGNERLLLMLNIFLINEGHLQKGFVSLIEQLYISAVPIIRQNHNAVNLQEIVLHAFKPEIERYSKIIGNWGAIFIAHLDCLDELKKVDRAEIESLEVCELMIKFNFTDSLQVRYQKFLQFGLRMIRDLINTALKIVIESECPKLAAASAEIEAAS